MLAQPYSATAWSRAETCVESYVTLHALLQGNLSFHIIHLSRDLLSAPMTLDKSPNAPRGVIV